VHILLVEDNVGDARLLREAFRGNPMSFQVSVVKDPTQREPGGGPTPWRGTP
jgi:hypothetical protein